MRPIRLGIIGCGGISHRHAPAAATSTAVTIVACCDTGIETAEAWAAAYGCEASFADYRTMIAAHELDGVLLATWPVDHCEQILACLEAGVRAVLCEKSLTISGAQALDVYRAAADARAIVAEAFMYRHHPALEQVERLVAAGEVGAVDTVRASFDHYDPESSAPDDALRDWRQKVETGGGVPYDLACYCVDACNHFAGAPPRRAIAVGGRSERYETVNRLYGLIEYANGVVGIVTSSSKSDFDHTLRISGPRGHVVLPVAWRIEGPIDVTLSRSVRWGRFHERRFPIAAADPYRLQLEQLAAVVRGEAEPAPTLAESVVTAFTLDALLQSAAERAPLDVHLPEELSAKLVRPKVAPRP